MGTTGHFRTLHGHGCRWRCRCCRDGSLNDVIVVAVIDAAATAIGALLSHGGTGRGRHSFFNSVTLSLVHDKPKCFFYRIPGRPQSVLISVLMLSISTTSGNNKQLQCGGRGGRRDLGLNERFFPEQEHRSLSPPVQWSVARSVLPSFLPSLISSLGRPLGHSLVPTSRRQSTRQAGRQAGRLSGRRAEQPQEGPTLVPTPPHSSAPQARTHSQQSQLLHSKSPSLAPVGCGGGGAAHRSEITTRAAAVHR